MKRNETIDAVAEVAAGTATDVTEVGATQLKKFLDDLEASLQSVRKATDSKVRQAVNVSSRAARATDDYVRESPWKAIGIAAIAALAVGSLVMSRRGRRESSN